MNDVDVPRFGEVFRELTQPEGISRASVRRVFDAILAGRWTPVQVAGFLVALRLSGETPSTIAAAVESMRAAMVGVEHDYDHLLDTCGTGGDGFGTLNLSTGAAIIAAAAGIPVAKHGNRAISSQAGSADVLEALGVPITLSAAAAAEVLRRTRITFMLAPTHHPAMRHAGPVRRELGIRTIFNCLGPLANPARVTHQLVGAYEDGLRKILGEALRELGTRRAWIVRGVDGLDELSPCGRTRVTELDAESISEFEVSPEDFGLQRLEPEAVRGGDATYNARVLRQVLSGEPHPARDAFLLNGAAALVVGNGLLRRLRPTWHGSFWSRRLVLRYSSAGGKRLKSSSTEPRWTMGGVLERIIEAKWREIEHLKNVELPAAGALRTVNLRRTAKASLRLLCEIKRRSPSAGALSTVLGVAERALAYERAGAHLVSVLCDAHFFDGSYSHLTLARQACSLPLLCKDFVLDEVQVRAARAFGADAILLIVRCLSDERLAALMAAAGEQQLTPLVEVTTEAEAERALEAGAQIIGVNARDLDTLEMNSERAARVLEWLGGRAVRVHLSGLATPAQVSAVRASGVDAALIGEALMRQDDPEPLLRELSAAAGGENVPGGPGLGP